MNSIKSKYKKHLKICFICSAGGHLKQVLTVVNSINYEKYLVTYDAPHINKTMADITTYVVSHPKRNPFLIIRNSFESIKLLLKEKPQVIISTGADVAVPTCILGGNQLYKIFPRRFMEDRFFDLCNCRVQPDTV
jgi:beta-1,4-N-acetylglucosaminyltransferase